MKKESYRTTMPFVDGLSPLTDKTRKNVPWMGGGPFDTERKNFDFNMGGDHKFIGPDPDGLSHAVGGVFNGEWNNSDLTVPYSTETVVVDAEGEEHVYDNKPYEMVLLDWKGKKYKYVFRRMKRSKEASTGDESMNLVPLIADVMPGCFKVESESATLGKREVGSCFCISNGRFLTCAHVISKKEEDPSTLAISIVDDNRRFSAKVEDIDYDMDLAMISCRMQDYYPLSLKSISEVMVGQEIICVGSPHGFDNNVSRGIVSSKGRVVEGDEVTYFFIDLSVSPGSSGGPVVDVSDGSVVGIAAIIVEPSGNYGLNAAIPCDFAMDRFSIGGQK